MVLAVELRQLKYFAEIAASGSLREASARLHVAQPALTRHLRSLEDELGVQLCVRHARGIRLTPVGTRFLEHASSVVRSVGEIRSQLSEDLESPSGLIAIGASGAMGQQIFGAIAEQISKDYPRIALQLMEGGAYSLLAALDAGRIDIALLVAPEARAGYTFENLVTEPVFLVGNIEDARLDRESISLSEIGTMPLAAFDRTSGPRKLFDNAAARAGIKMNIAYELESAGVILDFVKRGLAFALLPHSSIETEFHNKRIRAVQLEGISITRTLVTRDERMDGSALESVLQIIREQFGKLIEQGTFGKQT